MLAGTQKTVPPQRFTLCTRWYGLLGYGAIVCLVLSTGGCQQWPGNHAMRQYQIESERLLSEFRSQKKRAEDLEQRNVQLERRLGESEREIAKLQGRNPSSRMANIPGPNSSMSGPSIGSMSGSLSGGTGLPDARPGPSGRLSSGNSGSSGSSALGPGDPRNSNQWRPIPGR
ncbi:MAG: hypothetical protein NTV29_18830 [Planctomycetota bacterium]|nr:hypothetical protein [Planctomycetota bacterium]